MSISADDYQEDAFKLALPQCKELSYLTLGLCNEAGEVAGKLKKAMRQDAALDFEAMALELGDVMWYVAGAAKMLNYSLSDIMEMNLGKLQRRNAEGTIQGDGDKR